MTDLGLSLFVWWEDILKRNKMLDDKNLYRGKLKNTKTIKNTYPVKTELSQNNLCYILNEMYKN